MPTPTPTSTSTPTPAPHRTSALTWHATASALVAAFITAIWGMTGGGSFWPAWVWFGLGAPLAVHGAVRVALDSDAPVPPGLRVHAAVSVAAAGIVIAVWALSGAGSVWFLWPILALTVALAAHTLWFRLTRGEHEQELEARVDTLTRTRSGALDVQAAELRRIERNLHDGAQARLVALTMQLGRAELQLDDRPEVADLIRQAKAEAGEAIAELRDLARGIAPPILADRGLGAAVEALARRSAAPVTVDGAGTLTDRLPAPVETAAYFVVAEALTNAAKHAGGARARVRLDRQPGRLVVEVLDEGPGGADPHGGGLTGLRQRVEALDGAFEVISPEGTGTTVRAELPCAS